MFCWSGYLDWHSTPQKHALGHRPGEPNLSPTFCFDKFQVKQPSDSVIEMTSENFYQQEYDDLLHETEPFSDPCIRAVNNHVSSFSEIVKTASEAWCEHNYAIVFAPDHGAHVDPKTGNGNHGEDIPEDMDLFHWYGLKALQSNPT